MRPFYLKCAVVGLVVAVVTLVFATPLDALAVLIGMVISVFNLLGFTVLIKRMMSGERPKKPTVTALFFAFLVLLKLGLVFTAIGFACYFLNPIYVVAGLTSLLIGVVWQAVLPGKTGYVQ